MCPIVSKVLVVKFLLLFFVKINNFIDYGHQLIYALCSPCLAGVVLTFQRGLAAAPCVSRASTRITSTTATPSDTVVRTR